MSAVLAVEDLNVVYRSRRGFWRRRARELLPVAGVSLSVQAGETVGLVGESGCGKSSLARAIVGAIPARSGTITVAGESLAGATGHERRRIRRSVQLIFQDPHASLNPRLTVGQAVSEAAMLGGAGSGERSARRGRDLLEEVGLSRSLAASYPHELSGGQRQRVAIARALAAAPKAIIADEPTSALDVTVQARILNLLRDVQAGRGLALLLISHDLQMVQRFARRVLVMYLGRIVEEIPLAAGGQPLHPYSRALAAAAPSLAGSLAGRGLTPIGGEVPSLASPPAGCAYHPRCPLCEPECRNELPPLNLTGGAHRVRCPIALREHG